MPAQPPESSITAIADAILHRDVDRLLSTFFENKPPRLKESFRYESEYWDFKAGCPGHSDAKLWAEIAADVMAFYNTNGGVVFFGIADQNFSYCGTKTHFDGKLFNDKIRKYCGDRFFVSYCKSYADPSGRYLGVALIPKRGLQVLPLFADAPEINGKKYFKAGDIAIRRGDETLVLRGEKAVEYLAQIRIPTSNAQFLVDEPGYQIIRPGWDEFVHRDELCTSVIEALKDERTFVTSITGIGGAGKTALGCWGALEAYNKQWFDFIISTSAKDRELTSSGIREVTPTASSLEDLLNVLCTTIGFSDLIQLPLSTKIGEVTNLIKGSKMLLFVDNLETVVDETLIRFLDNLPMPVKAILTSRTARVRKAVYPIEVGPFEKREAATFLDIVAAKRGRSFIHEMPNKEKELVVESCFRIPLVIEWFVGAAKDAPAAVELARTLERSPRRAEEVLEFSFRRIHEQLTPEAQKVLKVLSLFSEPQPIESLSAGCDMRMDVVNAALDNLTDASLLVRSFDPRLNDTTFGMLPITRRFAYTELGKAPGLEQSLRRSLSVFYEGADIADPDQRKAIVAIRQGKQDVDTLLVDAAKQVKHLGKINQAEELLIQACQRNPTSWRAHRELGDLYKNEKKTSLALEAYKKASLLAPKKGNDRALIFREYGIVLRDAATADALENATAALEVALAETPNDPVCQFVLAQVLCRRGAYRKAEPLLRGLVASAEARSRRKAYPLLFKCLKLSKDLIAIAELKAQASRDGVFLK